MIDLNMKIKQILVYCYIVWYACTMSTLRVLGFYLLLIAAIACFFYAYIIYFRQRYEGVASLDMKVKQILFVSSFMFRTCIYKPRESYDISCHDCMCFGQIGLISVRGTG